MSYANGTQYYNLPQTVGTDKRDWFDTNSAFAAVDAALHAAATGQAADAEAISVINASLATDEANITALQTASTTQAASISALQTTVTTQAAQIADVRQDAEDMITANNEGAAATSTRAYDIGDYFIYNDVLYKATASIAVGDTIVPNTNCEATNVDTEITAIKSDLAGKADTNVLIKDVSNKFGFGSVFTSMNCKAVIINNKLLVLHLDGYKSDGLPVGENEHFCTVNATLLARIESGNHIANVWSGGANPHTINVNKDATGLAYTERVSTFQYIQTDIVFILAD